MEIENLKRGDIFLMEFAGEIHSAKILINDTAREKIVINIKYGFRQWSKPKIFDYEDSNFINFKTLNQWIK